MSDRIEKRIELNAPLSRVWRALTDYREFGGWFQVKLDGLFVPGEVSCGQMTYPGGAREVGSRGREDGAGAAVFLHLAASQVP